MTFLSAWRLVLLVAARRPARRLPAGPAAPAHPGAALHQRRPARLGRAQRPAGSATSRRRRCSLSLVVLTLAFAQPAMAMRTPKDRATIMLTLDTSASMTATDVAPSRLAAAEDQATAVRREPAARASRSAWSPSTAAPGCWCRRRTDTAPRARPRIELADRRRRARRRPPASDRRSPRSPPCRRAPAGKPAPAVIVLMSDGTPTIGDGDTVADGGRRRGRAGREGAVGADRHDRVRHLRRHVDRPGPGHPGARPTRDAMARIAQESGGQTFTAETRRPARLDLRPDRPRRRLHGRRPGTSPPRSPASPC